VTAAPKPSALFLSPEAPYPAIGGGAIRTASLLEYLRKRYLLDLVLFRQPGAADPAASLPDGLARRTAVLVLPPNSKSAPARAARNALRFVKGIPPLVDRFAGFQSGLESFLGSQRYDLAVVEHFWCAPYAGLIATRARRTVLDLHNIESALMAGRARTAGWPASVLFRRFAGQGRRLESRWLPRFDLLLAASEPDVARIRGVGYCGRVVVYPNALPKLDAPERPERHAVAFSGNLEYDPNFNAVRWFHARIWPLLAARWPNLVWRIIGRNPGSVRRLVGGDPRIEVTGEIEDAVGELASSAAVVVPLRAGSGTRVKILEAWAARRAVVSTSLGAEGLGARDGEHLLIADEPEGFADAVSRLLDDAPLRLSLGAAGREYYESRFTWEAAWPVLDGAL
jgi:glycosyltransferase involved in cell wall biosynthesis